LETIKKSDRYSLEKGNRLELYRFPPFPNGNDKQYKNHFSEVSFKMLLFTLI